MFGTLSPKYLKCKEEIRRAHEAGMQIMPSTPGMGGYYYDEVKKETYYQDAWPAFAGERAVISIIKMWRRPVNSSAVTWGSWQEICGSA